MNCYPARQSPTDVSHISPKTVTGKNLNHAIVQRIVIVFRRKWILHKERVRLGTLWLRRRHGKQGTGLRQLR
jgi:hypothetical protein